MRNLNFRNIKRASLKNSIRFRPAKAKSTNKYERRSKMKHINLSNKPKKTMIVLSVLLFSIFSASLNGCGDSNITGANTGNDKISAAGEFSGSKVYDSTIINLDLNLKFKSRTISDSRILESVNGNNFNHIAYIDRDLKPNEVLDIQELQPFGIFGLYLNSSNSFVLTNSDGLSLSSRSILLEKCSFIDLKVKNNTAKILHITGFAAGE